MTVHQKRHVISSSSAQVCRFCLGFIFIVHACGMAPLKRPITHTWAQSISQDTLRLPLLVLPIPGGAIFLCITAAFLDSAEYKLLERFLESSVYYGVVYSSLDGDFDIGGADSCHSPCLSSHSRAEVMYISSVVIRKLRHQRRPDSSRARCCLAGNRIAFTSDRWTQFLSLSLRSSPVV